MEERTRPVIKVIIVTPPYEPPLSKWIFHTPSTPHIEDSQWIQDVTITSDQMKETIDTHNETYKCVQEYTSHIKLLTTKIS